MGGYHIVVPPAVPRPAPGAGRCVACWLAAAGWGCGGGASYRPVFWLGGGWWVDPLFITVAFKMTNSFCDDVIITNLKFHNYQHHRLIDGLAEQEYS